jgi:hypothetical protein
MPKSIIIIHLNHSYIQVIFFRIMQAKSSLQNSPLNIHHLPFTIQNSPLIKRFIRSKKANSKAHFNYPNLLF